MSEEEKIEESREDGKTESPEEQSEVLSPESGVEAVSFTESEIKTMEVHHHPQVEKKNLKEYLLEGLMIFLAVMMGFIAENIREKISDREREKEFMKSLIKDIKDDQTKLKDEQKVFELRVGIMDSLIGILDGRSIPSNTNDLYYYARLATKSDVFPVNTRTIDQMRNAGGFRVIKNDQVAMNIMSYYSIILEIRSWEDAETSEENEYRKIAVQIFSASVFNQINSTIEVKRPVTNPQLRTSDRKLLGDLSGWVHYIKNTRIGLYDYKKKILEKGEKLIGEIQKEYHLENE